MEQKIKILTINTAGLNRNGITTVMYDYYSRFDNKRFDIHTVADETNNSQVRQSFHEANIVVHILPARKHNTAKYFFALISLIRKYKIDIIHVHGNSATVSIELLAAAIAGCKIRIAHSHNSTCDAKKADHLLRPLFYRVYTHAFACGQLAGEWLFGIRDFKIIKNGRDVNQYAFNEKIREETRKQLGLTDDTMAIGHIGNFNEQKNHTYLIKIFESLQHKKPDSKLFLAGYGHCESNIRSLVKELNLEDKIVFLGVINNVPDILQAMDVMVLPSLYEGLPLVVVEWQIAALPCVISDTVTDECVYTDLVRFESLQNPYEMWAEKIVESVDDNRKNNVDGIIKLSQKNGYDINCNVRDLMQFMEKIVK